MNLIKKNREAYNSVKSTSKNSKKYKTKPKFLRFLEVFLAEFKMKK